MMNQSSDFIFAVLFLARYMGLYIFILSKSLNVFCDYLYLYLYPYISIFYSDF